MVVGTTYTSAKQQPPIGGGASPFTTGHEAGTGAEGRSKRKKEAHGPYKHDVIKGCGLKAFTVKIATQSVDPGRYGAKRTENMAQGRGKGGKI